MTYIAKRRRTKLRERLTPCDCCGHPISQRHHIFGMPVFGENDYAKPLCANCHEIYHLLVSLGNEADDSNKTKVTRASALLGQVIQAWGEDDPRFVYLCRLYWAVQAAKPAMVDSLSAFHLIEYIAEGVR